MDLFPSGKTTYDLPDAKIIYIPDFFSKTEADHYFECLKNTTPWKQDEIKVFGKVYKQPRLTALYAENEAPYSYSSITMYPSPLTNELIEIKRKVEQVAEHGFTTVLLNLYRNGNDSNGWHADNEKELGEAPVIASVSFGEVRPFHFKHRTLKKERYKLDLEHGSLLIMKGPMQKYWLHQIAKTKKQISERINLTFRTIKPQ